MSAGRATRSGQQYTPAISDLVENADLKEQTVRDYIVEYIVMRIRSALDQTRSE